MSLFRATTNITRRGRRRTTAAGRWRLILWRTERGDKDEDTLELGKRRGEKITTQYSFFAWRRRAGPRQDAAAGRWRSTSARRLLPGLTCERARAWTPPGRRRPGTQRSGDGRAGRGRTGCGSAALSTAAGPRRRDRSHRCRLICRSDDDDLSGLAGPWLVAWIEIKVSRFSV